MRRHPRCYRRRKFAQPSSFNWCLYECLLERHRNGLLIELAFWRRTFPRKKWEELPVWCGRHGSASVPGEEVVRCADVIRKEQRSWLALEQPERLSEEDIRKLLEAMRDKKS